LPILAGFLYVPAGPQMGISERALHSEIPRVVTKPVGRVWSSKARFRYLATCRALKEVNRAPLDVEGGFLKAFG